MRKIVIQSKEEAKTMVTARKSGNRDHKAGTVPDSLKRRMSDLLAGEFSEVGEEVYDKAMAQVSESVKTIFDQGTQELGEKIKKKLGDLGYQESIKHIRPWLESLISDMRTKGMPNLVNALDGITSEFSVKYQEGGKNKTAPAATDTEETEDILEVKAPTPEPAKVEEVSEQDLTAILEGKQPAPAAAAEEVKQEAAASTFANVKRRLRTLRKQRLIAAEVPEGRDDILKSAAVHLKVLEE